MNPTYGCLPDEELEEILTSLVGPGVDTNPVPHGESKMPYEIVIELGFETSRCAWPFRQSNLTDALATWGQAPKQYIRICWN